MTHRKKLTESQFKMMLGLYKFADSVFPYVAARAKSFGVSPGMTVVDYGCGPGRYTAEFAKLVGSEGRVFAVDLLQIALDETEKRLELNNLDGKNVTLKLADGYESGLPNGAADIVCAVDMFHHVEPEPFLKETHRITKRYGALIVSGGHQSKSWIKKAVAASGLWKLSTKRSRFLTYQKI